MKRFILIFFVTVLSLSDVYPLADRSSNQGWKAGVAKIKITPEENLWMAGYAIRNKPSDGMLHDLWAKALFIEDSLGNNSLLITLDLLGLPKALSDTIRDRLERELDLSRAQIILNSSHTHSGPVLTGALSDIYPLDSVQEEKIDNYSNWLARQIIDLAARAKRSMKPAAIFAQNGVVRFQVNRRNNQAGKIAELTELKGPNDFAVPVLKVEDKRGRIKVIVFGYACHPTVLSGYEWSGDYPGFAQIELEKKYKGATAMFFQGAGADQNPLPRRSVSLAKQYGQELASAVECVLAEDMNKLTPHLVTAYSEIQLPLSDPPAKQELLALTTDSVYYINKWSNRILESIEAGESFEKDYPYPVQFWKMGNQKIISLGGELLVGYSNKLKKILGNDVFVMGYSNDVMAYIPTEKVLQEGRYEGESSQMVYGLPAVWASGIEKEVITNTVALATGMEVSGSDEILKKMNEVLNEIPGSKQGIQQTLLADKYFSGFENAHDTYNAISRAGNGKIYYVLSSQLHDVAGQMYVYDPSTDKTQWLADLNAVCGEQGKKSISQGKSHVRFFESGGKLYFATHVGYYEMIDGMECLPVNAPEGFSLYPGGHFLSFDPEGEKFEDLAIAPEGEGILTMTMDRERKQIYAITWPTGYFLHYDVNKDVLKNLGPASGKGEDGKVGEDYRVLCRSMFVDPGNGKVYYSTPEGDIYYYEPGMPELHKMNEVDLRKDYFGKYDHTRPGNMAYNWRTIVWSPKEEVAYGVHGNSGYLFRFDPRNETIEIVERITSEPSRKSGMFDQFSYGYLGFDLGPDDETLYYLTGGPIYIDGKRVKGVDEIAMGAARGLENLHLITYHLPSGKYTDHGPVFYTDGSRPTYVNSIAVGKDGNVYTLARFDHEGKLIQDLVKISLNSEKED